MSVHRFVLPDEAHAAAACAHQIAAHLADAMLAQEFVSLATSGGKSPRRLFQELAKAEIRWNKVQIFWVDDRCVHPTDEQSNFRMAQEYLIGPAHIPARNVHRIHTELPPEEAAARYADDIRALFRLEPPELPHFDVIHLGMGSDGHTASLFPGDPLVEDRENIAAATYNQTAAQWRVTLLPGVLLAARHTVLYCPGGDKAETIRAILDGEYDPVRYPAQITRLARSVSWFLDQDAGRLLVEA